MPEFEFTALRRPLFAVLLRHSFLNEWVLAMDQPGKDDNFFLGRGGGNCFTDSNKMGLYMVSKNERVVISHPVVACVFA